ncbi:A24 family peptidase [Neobacillus sp. SAB-20_R2A]|uniref:A24 family peptidase n=1 Tax=Neobacillus sp. SAB-20_R2A TaxID=3120519 RepID=UPI003C6E6555
MENIMLLIVLMVCMITDLKSRKIYNKVTIPTILFGLINNSLGLGLDGFLFSSKGLLTGLGLLFIPFVLGGIGAGDVKLLAAIGSVKGSIFVLNSFLYGAVIGGIIAFVIMVRRGILIDFVRRVIYSIILLKATQGSLNLSKEDNLALGLPYGVAIALGTACTYFLGGLL